MRTLTATQRQPASAVVSAAAMYLCAGCHTGTVADWHQPCIDCHADWDGHGNSLNSPETSTEDGYPNDSSNCTLCHTHGSRTNVGSIGNVGLDDDGCSEHHCHDFWRSF